MSQLPKNWSSIQLKNLLSFVLGGDWGKDADYQDDDFETVFCIRGTEFKNWSKEKGITSVERKVKKASAQKRALKLGDILVEISGGGPEQPVGRTVLIDEDALKHNSNYPKVCTNFIRLARPSDSIDSRYLNYYLRSFYASGEVVNYQGGSNNLRNLKFKEYETIEVPIAPQSEQKRIADKLDSVLTKVETAQVRLDKIPTILKRFRQSVLAAATSGELTKNWRESNGLEDWEHVKLKDVGKGFNYGSSTKSQSEGKIPVLRMGNLQGGKLDWEKLVFTSDEAEIEKYKLQPGDVLFNRTNSPELVGKTSIYRGEREAIFAGYLIKVQGTDKLDAEYLNIQLNSSHARDYCWAVKTDGVSQSNINAKKLQAYEFELPSIEEQIEIIRVVTELLSSADLVEKQYKAAKLRVDKMTHSILAIAFSGKLFSPISEEDRVAVTVKTQNSEPQHNQPKAIDKEPDQQTEVVSKTVNKSSNEQASEVFQLLKKNSKGMSAQALFDAQSENTFNAIDDLFSELKKLIEQEMVIQAGEGENCTFKATKK
ncbi:MULTISPECIES: restriction endonuclease subunit S [Marinomonas]|uniref:Restriction endonuclease subunit S n=1 Tax=Marinomonas arctica TaxID=383750 RepID=A0A7H1JBP5_9GAMM|nr:MULTISPECIES: restriction endonuclease subunit S [Marinomonas]QNT07911.1 restriction endonuclease subunit S [Marinomonas arctica]GGN26226.1 type I restriction endonuclease EcoKI subunit S [Marinomonas arctica]